MNTADTNAVLTIYHSNRLDILKDLLVELIRRDPLPNPLQDDQILVQSPGMAQWLRLQLAEGLGIAAAINFPLPASFLWEMYIRVLPDVPKRSAFNKEAMTWKIMALIRQMLDKKSFKPLRSYLADDADNLKNYQLAGKIADIFDQYLVYRPEWILKWEAGDNLDDITGQQQWQPELWRALVDKTAELNQSHWHRANMHQQFNEYLTAGKNAQRLPERLFVFGISALPPHFIESLQALGQQTQVHLMITNPCRYFWGDIKDPKYLARMASRRFLMNGQNKERDKPFLKTTPATDACTNPLLASMGKLGRDYLFQIHDMNAVDIDAFADISRTSLLSHIQADILDLLDGSIASEKQAIDHHDKSLDIHSCHSPLREVEVLHDQLLHLFEHNPDITPKDIVVMLPDVDAYTPWIQAVFASIERNDPRYIPFSISDRSARTEHPVLTAVLQLLDLDNSRCTAPELLELLETPALQRRFKLNQNSLETLRLWVNEAGIRWGIDSHQQDRFSLPTMTINTWLFGLRRMLLGYAMPEASGLHAGILPFDSVQGMDAALCGQLGDFIDQIEQLAETLNQPRPVNDWTVYIHNLLEQFFLPEEDDEYAMKAIRDAMEHLHEQLEDADHQTPLSKSIVVSYLTERITNTRNSQRFLAGQVNFCTLMPMRSIPFKVVCLLGMNDGAYPRTIAPAGFDLIAQNSQRGDRSRREDDRYLFLEALLSAQQHFYISYVGKSILDNSERAPSVLVTELLNYCEQGFEVDKESHQSLKKHLITKHPLQAFSPETFMVTQQKQGSSLFSYAREWLPTAARQGLKPLPFLDKALTAIEEPDTIELPELIRFYKNPCKYFCNRRLKVFFEDNDEALEETEPFDMGGLEQYQLQQALLETLVAGEKPETLLTRQKAMGLLPHGAFGELLMDEQVKTMTAMADYVSDLITDSTPADDIAINLTINGVRLTGWLRQHRSLGLLRYRPARIKGKDILTAWIEHLCYCASGHENTTTVVGLDRKKCTWQEHNFEPISTHNAREYLAELVSTYLEGLQNPQPLFPETALAWLSQDDDETARKQAHTCFEGNDFGSSNFAEGRDPYISRIYPDLDSVFEKMTELATNVLGPALAEPEGES